MKKIASIFVSALLLLSAIVPASAATPTDVTDKETEISWQRETARKDFSLDKDSVTDETLLYFEGRNEYLKNKAFTFHAVQPMVNDEETHLAALKNQGIVRIDATAEIKDIQIRDSWADVTVEEKVRYFKNSAFSSETVEHKISVCTSNNGLIVAADEYKESFSDFRSCSYVDENVVPDGITATGGSLCILAVADQQVGQPRKNYTDVDYYFAWCARFVQRCAAWANVPSSVIPRTDLAPTMANYGDFFYSKAYGGTRTPMAGDLFFLGPSSDKSEIKHVGIVDSVSGNSFWSVEGNGESREYVTSENYSLSSSSVMGFTRPKYAQKTHTMSDWKCDNTSHWKKCVNCKMEFNKGAHTASGTWHKSATQHWKVCSVCGLDYNLASHTASSTWKSNGIYHWKACSTCGEAISSTKVAHKFKKQGAYYVCSTCGYKTTKVIGTQGMDDLQLPE